MNQTTSFVWIFVGAGSKFPSGVFSSSDLADAWIAQHKLSGVLTRYPVDIGVFDWAVAHGLFRPIKDHHKTPEFVGRFSSAGQDHYHYENGQVI